MSNNPQNFSIGLTNVTLLGTREFTAFARSTSRTGWSSVGEDAITLTPHRSLSAALMFQSCLDYVLAAWKRRMFSMAITAWSAKVLRSAICLSEMADFYAPNDDCSDRHALLHQRSHQHCPMADQFLQLHAFRILFLVRSSNKSCT